VSAFPESVSDTLSPSSKDDDSHERDSSLALDSDSDCIDLCVSRGINKKK
jgi:hypothetical protein